MKPETTEDRMASETKGAKITNPPITARTRTRESTETAKRGRKKRTARTYPAASFEDSLRLAEEILKQAPDGKIRRLTFLKATERSATSSATKMLITNSNKYSITKGSYAAEWLEVTATGKLAASSETAPKDQLKARFSLAIEGIPAFRVLYEEYRGKKLPSHEVMKDALQLADGSVADLSECIDLFIVNAKFLGLLQTVGGSETLIPLEHVVDELPASSGSSVAAVLPSVKATNGSGGPSPSKGDGPDWGSICFYISPIGEENSEERLHSDLFLSHLVEPALRDFNLRVVRADQIGASGMITSQILEHILKSRLVIADLSFKNPNVFYELALRHASRLPIVQIIRKTDDIPFDVDQVRTIQIDNSGIYTLVPKLETYRSEISTHVRQTLSNVESVTNPLTVFCPAFAVTLPA